jgi:hypothetical protein
MKHLTDGRPATVSRLEIALIASAAIAVAACGGSAIPSPSATSSPRASVAAAVDPCLVGTWTTVGQNQNSPANDEQIATAAGPARSSPSTPQGGMTIDTHAAQPVVFLSAGAKFTATVTGTGRGTLSTTTSGTDRVFSFTPSADDTRKTASVDSTGAELGPPRQDSAFSAVYTCAPGRFTFYKTAVSYMIDGPIVTLTAGSGNASSTASPAPS